MSYKNIFLLSIMASAFLEAKSHDSLLVSIGNYKYIQTTKLDVQGNIGWFSCLANGSDTINRQFADGTKQGFWVELLQQGEGLYYFQGSYTNGKKTGNWWMYTDEKILHNRVTFLWDVPVFIVEYALKLENNSIVLHSKTYYDMVENVVMRDIYDEQRFIKLKVIITINPEKLITDRFFYSEQITESNLMYLKERIVFSKGKVVSKTKYKDGKAVK